jgi:catechol 2,3-dioxygenase
MTVELSLASVALGVADPSRAEAFYCSVFGLQAMPGPDGGARCLGHGVGHPLIELRRGAGVLHFALRLRGASLSEFERRIATSGTSLQRDPEGEALRLEDPDGNLIVIQTGLDDCGSRTTDGSGRPQRADHITFATRQIKAMTAFYHGVLGLRISDSVQDDFVWLRGDRHHHTVAMVRSDETGLDHYSFEVGSWANIKEWCDRFFTLGVPVMWGPGRHGPGNNVFVFIEDPDGYRIELSCEMEQFRDDLVAYPDTPRVWAPGSHANLWGPQPTWRKGMNTAPSEAVPVTAERV